MKLISIKSGLSDIVFSGTVISFKGNPIEFIFDNGLRMIIKFEDEKDKSELRVEKKKTDPAILELTFFNFKDPFGSGNTEPLHLGYSNERKLYLSYRIYALKDSDKTIQYTFYEGEPRVPK
jgi:hypothetical protein